MHNSPIIIWLRQDLRLEDHPAFQQAALLQAPVIALYIFAPEEEGAFPMGAASRSWLHHSLESLRQELHRVNVPLVTRQGSSLTILKEMIQETRSNRVFWSRLVEPAAIKRDQVVFDALQAQGIEVTIFNASYLYRPEAVLTRQGKPFQVFTPFYKTTQHIEREGCLFVPSKSFPKVKAPASDTLALLPKIHWDTGFYELFTPGSKAAKARAKAFCATRLETYEIDRNRPDIDGASLLSPHLHFGEISPYYLWEQVKASESYTRELIFREFSASLLYHFPHTAEKPLRAEFAHFPWSRDRKKLERWKKGQTGFPIVDAGMRQLWQTGWMHNRVRMIVGSFLVKDLMIHWLHGAHHFWDTLVDADLASNSFNWQWVAGSGADAAPYFRIFNPILQGQKFDPEGNYIRKWVPELRGVSEKSIHLPYGEPIVDHDEARARALEAFKSLK